MNVMGRSSVNDGSIGIQIVENAPQIETPKNSVAINKVSRSDMDEEMFVYVNSKKSFESTVDFVPHTQLAYWYGRCTMMFRWFDVRFANLRTMSHIIWNLAGLPSRHSPAP